MPQPATSRDLLDLIRRSGVVEDARLEKFLLETESFTSPKDLLLALLQAGLVTNFQAEALAQGRWKGFTIGGYRLMERLGKGGMGQVFLAEHMALRKQVALKVLNSKLSNDHVILERFAREAQAAAAVSHPNIVHVIDVDIDHRPAFLVMEYVKGMTLQSAVSQAGSFSAGLAANCGRQMALALQVVHEANMVHRDIKPANLLIDRTGNMKVLDLGIVRIDCETSGGLTMTAGNQLVLGTADYLAPEQALDSHRVDIRADIYGLGGTLYFMLAGHSPFPTGSTNAKLTRKQLQEPTPIQKLRPDLEPELADIINRMLSKERDLRPATPLEVALALTPFATPDDAYLRKLFQVSSRTDDTLTHGNFEQTPPPTPVANATAETAITAVLKEATLPDQITIPTPPPPRETGSSRPKVDIRATLTPNPETLPTNDDFSNLGTETPASILRHSVRNLGATTSEAKGSSVKWIILGGLIVALVVTCVVAGVFLR